MEDLFSWQTWQPLFETFEQIGPIAPIFLCLLESLIPALPLVAIVTLNIASFGAFWGFVYSYIGSLCGSILVYEFFHRFVKVKIQSYLNRPQIQKGLAWVSRQNNRVLFLIAVMPFTPSSLLNILFGLSDFAERSFIGTIALSKGVMIAALVLFGQTFVAAFEQPLWMAVSIALIAVYVFLSNQVSKRSGLAQINKKTIDSEQKTE